jgi:secondary thiamine-phosphate synthase enzyme
MCGGAHLFVLFFEDGHFRAAARQMSFKDGLKLINRVWKNQEDAMPHTLNLKTTARSDMVDITASVQRELDRTGIKDGLCTVYVPHTTAGITINEGADPAVCQDLLDKLNELVPRDPGYRHMEGNADSHVKASLMGSSVALPVEGGGLALGTWQKIFFCEFDGPRSRRVYVKVQGST